MKYSNFFVYETFKSKTHDIIVKTIKWLFYIVFICSRIMQLILYVCGAQILTFYIKINSRNTQSLLKEAIFEKTHFLKPVVKVTSPCTLQRPRNLKGGILLKIAKRDMTKRQVQRPNYPKISRRQDDTKEHCFCKA